MSSVGRFLFSWPAFRFLKETLTVLLECGGEIYCYLFETLIIYVFVRVVGFLKATIT